MAAWPGSAGSAPLRTPRHAAQYPLNRAGPGPSGPRRLLLPCLLCFRPRTTTPSGLETVLEHVTSSGHPYTFSTEWRIARVLPDELDIQRLQSSV